MGKVAWAFAVVAWAAVGRASAADAPRAWVEAGSQWTCLHDVARVGGTVRVARDLGRSGVLRAQVGLSASSFAAADAGIEARLCPRCRVSPVLGVGVGFLAEDEYAGSFARATAGIEAALSPRLLLRATVQSGSHGGEDGPSAAAIGLGWRF